MTKSRTVMSALSSLRPTRITNTFTGEIVSWETYEQASLTPLLDWVLKETQRLYDLDVARAHSVARTVKGSAESYGRANGYSANWQNLPRSVRAQSRVARLAVFKLITETASFERNPNPRKQAHRFSRTVNLGAVDSQMVRLEQSEEQLFLTWKCWEQEYELTFDIPSYILARNIKKWSLPVVSGKGFIFTVSEQPSLVPGERVAGVDLGRAEPFTLAILGTRNTLIAEYRARPQVAALNRKSERVLREVTLTRAKADAYVALKLDDTTLRQEITRLRNKASRLGNPLKNQVAADITRKSKRHNVSLLHVENLKWATGSKYGSKWNHGTTINKIEHTNARHGIKTKRINPRGSSQHCHSCGTKITHNTITRTVRCTECKTQLDRDTNAALNIAKKKNYPANGYRPSRSMPSSQEQHTVLTAPNSSITQQSTHC